MNSTWHRAYDLPAMKIVSLVSRLHEYKIELPINKPGNGLIDLLQQVKVVSVEFSTIIKFKKYFSQSAPIS
jgi:hypothetical protein